MTQGKYPAKGKILARLSEEQKAFLASTADLVWWKTADEALAWPEYLVRQIMRYGDLEQTIQLESLFGEEVLRKVLLAAEPAN